jgi:hypothetical protein
MMVGWSVYDIPLGKFVNNELVDDGDDVAKG